MVISATVIAEIAEAPPHVKAFYDELLTDYLTIVPIVPAARALQQAYIDAHIVTREYADDALHVAVATISDCAMIVSWNFKHIVNFRKVPLYNAVNVQQGYRPLTIHSPMEVVEYDEE